MIDFSSLKAINTAEGRKFVFKGDEYFYIKDIIEKLMSLGLTESNAIHIISLKSKNKEKEL